jgi:hypothetical protein
VTRDWRRHARSCRRFVKAARERRVYWQP